MDNQKRLVGHREWVSLPELGITNIHCKIDSGAMTSSLHAFYIDPFIHEGQEMVHFGVHPNFNDNETVVHCTAKVFDKRNITSSNGQTQSRYIIMTKMQLGGHEVDIQLSLANRENMQYKMLMGKRALDDHLIVDTRLEYQAAKPITIKE